MLINLTPHTIILRASNGTEYGLVPCGTVARVSSAPGALETIPGCPVPVAAPATWGEIVDLPAPWAGRLYIVSALVAQRAQRPDVVSPGTGPADGAIRDTEGRVIAVTRLVRW